MHQKIVLIGAPGTGKTTVLNELSKRKYFCMSEISRKIILKFQKKGIDKIFLRDPLMFSKLLLKGRKNQYLMSNNYKNKPVFFDRGIPDIQAYLDYFKANYPPTFLEKSKKYKYDKIFYFPPWEEIYKTDNERYESFEQVILIDKFLVETYRNLKYSIIKVPCKSVDERTNFIVKYACI